MGKDLREAKGGNDPVSFVELEDGDHNSDRSDEREDADRE